MKQQITLRREQPDDIPAIRRVHEAAFGPPAEAEIVDAVRATCPGAISLVAIEADTILGHVLFSPVSLASDDRAPRGMGLGPVAAEPDRRGEGIGSMLNLDETAMAGVSGTVTYHEAFDEAT